MNATTTAPGPVPEIVQRDFPGWLPPMLVKELRQGLRTRGFVGAFVVFQVIMLIPMLSVLASQTTAQAGQRGIGAQFFWILIVAQLVFIAPARALGGLSQEVENRSMELLMLTRLNAWGVVLGKWISLLAQATLLLVAALPYLVVRYFTESADVLADLQVCVALLGASAMLTAAGLWASGAAKILRIVVVVGLVWGAMVSLGTVGRSIAGVLGGRVGVSGGVASGSLNLLLVLLNGGVITAYFLVSAVRNIAPPAENHAFFARMLPMLAMLAAPVTRWLGSPDTAKMQLVFSGVFLGFVLMFEFGIARPIMASHWREWRRRGRLLALIGAGALPGWQSALSFGLVAGACWIGLVPLLIPDGTAGSWKMASRMMWLGVLALGGLAFPAVLRSFFRYFPGPPLLFYFFVLVLPVLLLGMGQGLAETQWKFGLVKAVMQLMPVSSFVSALGSPPPRAVASGIAQIIAMLIISIAIVRSLPYWRQVARFETGLPGGRSPT